MFRPVIGHQQVDVQYTYKSKLNQEKASPLQKLNTMVILKLFFQKWNNIEVNK
jgi:hypothetical protein